MSQRKILFGLLLFILLPGCSSSGSNSKSAKLKKHQQAWEKQNISDYQFDISIDCFCPQGLSPATIIVRSDTISAVLDPKTGKTLRTPNADKPVMEQLPDYYPTVSKLFDIIGKAIAQNYAHLDVRYNSDYGYPEQVNLEHSKKVSDDAITYTVSNFKLLSTNE